MTDVESIVTGVVWKVEKQPGDAVAEGEVLMVMESMKMEIPIESPVAGQVRSIAVSEGESVTEGQVVASIA